jgi:hypothetical protein
MKYIAKIKIVTIKQKMQLIKKCKSEFSLYYEGF